MRRLLTGGLAAAAVGALVLAPGSTAAQRKTASKPALPRLANRCFALRSVATGRFVGSSGETYRADQAVGTPFFWKPATLRTYLPRDPRGRLLGSSGGGVVQTQTPGPAPEWAVAPRVKRAVSLVTTDGRQLNAFPTGDLALGRARGRSASSLFIPLRARGCTAFPEAETDATGKTFRGTNKG